MASRNGLVLTGVDAARGRLQSARARGPGLLRDATEEALVFLEAQAKRILDAEIYEKPREPYDPAPDKDREGSLYASFFRELSTVAETTIRGVLGNSSPHAKYIEAGTDDEGTGSHFVPVVRGHALHFLNPATGEDVFAAGGITVKGIVPIRFLERALTEHRAEVVAIYRKHFEGLFRV